MTIVISQVHDNTTNRKIQDLDNILGGNNMSNQDIFDVLSDTEAKLFYAWCNDKDNAALKEAHKSAKEALKAFALATGCRNH